MVDPTRGFTLGGRIDVAVITARKRSLGQGNIFNPVCHSVHGGVPGPVGVCLIWGGGACSRGVCSGGGGGACSGGAWWRPPGRLLLRAVRILLVCILVVIIVLLTEVCAVTMLSCSVFCSIIAAI